MPCPLCLRQARPTKTAFRRSGDGNACGEQAPPPKEKSEDGHDSVVPLYKQDRGTG